MVKFWFVRDGYDPTTCAPVYDIPLEQCTDKLDLTKKHWLHGLNLALRLGSRNPRLATAPEPRHVVCEVNDQEASE